MVSASGPGTKIGDQRLGAENVTVVPNQRPNDSNQLGYLKSVSSSIQNVMSEQSDMSLISVIYATPSTEVR